MSLEAAGQVLSQEQTAPYQREVSDAVADAKVRPCLNILVDPEDSFKRVDGIGSS
jgi:hypothetical protein